jgi:hypothetical protein
MPEKQRNSRKGEKQQCSYPCCWAPAIKRGMCDHHYKIWCRTEDARAAIMAPGRNVRPEDMSAIYVIGFLETSFVKIGISSDVKSRISAMQTGCPYPMMPYAAMFSGREEVLLLEALTHRTLIELGVEFRGEWFEVPPVDAVAVIEKLAHKNEIWIGGPEQMILKIAQQDYDHTAALDRNARISQMRALSRSIAASLERLSRAG